jgi:hypothetical protein
MNKLFKLTFLIASFFLLLSSTSVEESISVSNETAQTSNNIGDDFTEGWNIGWCEGWKDVKGQNAYCPYVPYPPYPKYGTDSYRGGYNAAFKYGRCKAQDYQNCQKN